MSEFLQNYGLFLLIAILMVFCHMAHRSHGRKDQDLDRRSLVAEDMSIDRRAVHGRSRQCIHSTGR